MSSCDKEFFSYPGCLDNGDGTFSSVQIGVELGTDLNGNTIKVATRYLDAQGEVLTIADPTLVSVGACPVEIQTPADIDQKILCDVVDPNDPSQTVEFCRTTVTIFNPDDGSVVSRTVTDYDLGGTVEYTVQGIVEDCKNQCPPASAQGISTQWG